MATPCNANPPARTAPPGAPDTPPNNSTPDPARVAAVAGQVAAARALAGEIRALLVELRTYTTVNAFAMIDRIDARAVTLVELLASFELLDAVPASSANTSDEARP